VTPRRDFIMGAACLAGAGAAFGLRPRRRLSLLGPRKMEDIVPFAFGAWAGHNVSDLVAPKEEGDLASRLYGERLERIYVNASTGAEVMMLMAYGDTQSSELQLHRPEICYPAFGYEIKQNEPAHLRLSAVAMLPVRRLVAEASGQRENIVYWTRLGEFLPTTGREQQLDRLKTALGGYVADGVLARFSVIDNDADEAYQLLAPFIVDLIQAVRPNQRSPLIGTRLAHLLPA